jgi:hypothetical protein
VTPSCDSIDGSFCNQVVFELMLDAESVLGRRRLLLLEGGVGGRFMRMFKTWKDCGFVFVREIEGKKQKERKRERNVFEQSLRPHLGAQNRPPAAHMPV